MKVCPACNARAAVDAKSCPSCEHQFEAGKSEAEKRRPKKTMMGIPSVDQVDAQADGDASKAKQTQFGMPALDEDADEPGKELKTEVVSSEQLPIDGGQFSDDQQDGEDDATAQADSSTVAAALGRASKANEAGHTGAAAAWGLSSETDAEEDSKTAVVSPNELDFGETPDWYHDEEKEQAKTEALLRDNSGGGETNRQFRLEDSEAEEQDSQKTDEDDDADATSGTARQYRRGSGQDDRFGTLLGMSLEEQSDQLGAAGAMHRGPSADQKSDDDEEGDASTQALSPDQLAKIDQMGFSGDFGDETSEEQEAQTRVVSDSGRIQPGRDSHATPVSSEMTASPKLPKPGGDEQSVEAAPQTSKGGDGDNDQKVRKPQNTSPSGVLRTAGRRKKKKRDSDTAPPKGSSPATDNFSRSSVTGTGTYQATGRETGRRSGKKGEAEVDDLKLGGVGSGAKTSFATGQKREQVTEQAKASEASEESLLGDVPLDDISMSWDGQDTSTSEPDKVAKPVAEASPESTPKSPKSNLKDRLRAKLKSERKSEDSKREAKRKPELKFERADEPQPKSQPKDEAPEIQVDSIPELEPEPEIEPEPEPEEEPALKFGVGDSEKSESVPEVEVEPLSEPEPEPELEPESAPERAPEKDSDRAPSQPLPTKPPSSTPSSSPVSRPPGGSPVGGSSADAVPLPAKSASGEYPSFGAEPATTPGSSEPAPTRSGDELAAPAPLVDADEESGDADGVNRVVTLIQKSFGMLGAVVMIALAVVGVVISGLPEETVGIAVMSASVLLGVMVFALSVMPLSMKMQSVGFALVGVVALLGFVAGIAVGLSELLLISLVSGALLLFCAAGFPLVGAKMMD